MKWAIREAIDVYFKAKSVFQLGAKTFRAGEPVLIFDTVKTSTLEVAAEVSYVTGGRGNARLLSYEGDKTLTFNFEDALLSNEGLAILSGADLIPARNKHLPGAHPDARSVIAHYTEKYSVATNNMRDEDQTKNVYDDDTSLYPAGGPNDPDGGQGVGKYAPRGGIDNVWLTRKPYVGQNASIYVMLLDDAGEISGMPVQINLETDDSAEGADKYAYLRKFHTQNDFIAFDLYNKPMSTAEYPDPDTIEEAAIFDDQVAYYVDYESCVRNWVTAWGEKTDYRRVITAPNYGETWGGTMQEQDDGTMSLKDFGYYAYLLAPSGGIAQPKAYKEGSDFVYKVNVPSILYQDIVLLDYYVEYTHDATQVSILPDKFGPYMYVEGSSLVRRASDGVDLPVEFVIPKFKITTALTFTLAATGDPSTFTFSGDAYPDFSKFDLTRKVLADIQILDADDNYDGASSGIATADPTSYRRFKYNNDTNGEYIWKDRSLEPHQNMDYSDTGNWPDKQYNQDAGGPATLTPGSGLIDQENPKIDVDLNDLGTKVSDVIANAPAGSTLKFNEGIISERLVIDKNLTLEGTTEDGKETILQGGAQLAANGEPVRLTIKNMTLVPDANTPIGVTSQNQTSVDQRDATVIIENSTIRDFTGKAVYVTDAKTTAIRKSTFENCATGTDTGTVGDYTIDFNLVGVQGANIDLDTVIFKGMNGHKASVKVTQRGGPSDKGAGDIPMDIPQATIANFTMSNCDFQTDGQGTPVDLRIGTDHKTPTEPELKNTTGDFPVMISGNKTPVRVQNPYKGNEDVVTVPAGATGYKNAKSDFVVVGAATPVTPISINAAGYDDIYCAFRAAKAGDVVVLNEDIAISDDDVNISGDSMVAAMIPAGVTLDGNGHKITVGTITGKHILGVNGENVTIKNVTIEGAAGAKSGVVVSGVSAKLTATNVTINNCANCGIQVTNGGQVILDNYKSNGNAWGSVNCDKGAGGATPRVTFNSGAMAENVEIYTELVDIQCVTAPSLTEVIGVGDTLKGFKYYTSDMARLGVAAVVVDGKTTVYEDMVEAEEAADEAGVDVVIL